MGEAVGRLVELEEARALAEENQGGAIRPLLRRLAQQLVDGDLREVDLGRDPGLVVRQPRSPLLGDVRRSFARRHDICLPRQTG
jgi:hypothetical protein